MPPEYLRFQDNGPTVPFAAVLLSLFVLQNKMPDVDLGNRHPALQSMCSKD
jgi:hypothetical protein